MTSKKFLFVTSTLLSQETLTVFTSRLLQEGHEVAVMGPTGLILDEGVKAIGRITESRDYQPHVIVPLDRDAAVGAREAFKGLKVRHLHKDPLAYEFACYRSYGLSLIAKTGMPVIPYHVISNEGDRARLIAKMHEQPDTQWDTYEDNPDCLLPVPDGRLALPRMEGERITVGFLLSGRNLVTPAFVHYPMLGLLQKGGIKDWRGCVVIPTWNNKLAFIGNKVQQAMSAIGAAGFIFVDLLFPQGKRKAMVTNVSLQPPRGFLAATFLTGMTGFGVGDALHQVAGNKEFYLRTALMSPSFAFLVSDQQVDLAGFPQGNGWLEFPRSGYARGWYVSDVPEIPGELWNIRPTAEVKLDGQSTLDYALSRLEKLRLLPDENTSTVDPVIPGMEEAEEESPQEPVRFEPVSRDDLIVGEDFGDDLSPAELALLAQCNTGGDE